MRFSNFSQPSFRDGNGNTWYSCARASYDLMFDGAYWSTDHYSSSLRYDFYPRLP